ncbi:MAG: fibro-slime domain-containing protein, partial [Myxococcota bacterium]
CSGGDCAEVCGDGLKLGQEGCDDGNTRDGDGCSASCSVEAGFTCETIAEVPVLPVVLRDFIGTASTDSNNNYGANLGPIHRDFEKYLCGSAANRPLVSSVLDAAGKPTLATVQCVESLKSFAQWYRSDDAINRTVLSTLPLTAVGANTFEFFDSSFFPLDGLGFNSPTCANGALCEVTRTNGHNFHFTSETRYWFTFRGAEKLTFDGDDDVWVFIDGKLAVDIGGVHSNIQRWIQLPDPDNIDADAPTDGDRSHSTYVTDPLALQLITGRNYEVAVFQAERHTTASQYRLTLQNFLSARSQCEWTCGDGIATRFEVCDEGTAANTGAYGHCNADCLGVGPRCGDGVVQSEFEECDDGTNTTLYSDASTPSGACAPGCAWPTPFDACIPETCANAEVQCGYAADGCGDVLDCGACAEGKTCIRNTCKSCVPLTCGERSAECGQIADGCGGIVDCGGCGDGDSCVANRCEATECVPRKCAAAGANCGVIADGCGGTLACGTCTAPQSCGAVSPNVCGSPSCNPLTCTALNAACGTWNDGCGGDLECGDCPRGQGCGAGGVAGQCSAGSCAPLTCNDVDATCGRIGDGCGGSLDCGTCTAP